QRAHEGSGTFQHLRRVFRASREAPHRDRLLKASRLDSVPTMSRSSIRSFLRYGQRFLALTSLVSVVAVTSLSALASGCGDTVHNNEGLCVAQASVDPKSECDATKSSYY